MAYKALQPFSDREGNPIETGGQVDDDLVLICPWLEGQFVEEVHYSFFSNAVDEDDGGVNATEGAVEYAQKNQLDLLEVEGTMDGGRISKTDVEKYHESLTAPPEEETTGS